MPMNLKKFQIWIFASTLILNGCSTPYQVSSDTRPVGERLKANLLFNVPMGWVKNDPAEYEISLNPDGSVKAVSKTKSSGLTGFDEAVLQAIYKSQPYPPNKTGKVPEKFILSSRPNPLCQDTCRVI
jgi:TonB family protein